MTSFSLYKKLEKLPPNLKLEVQHFIDFLLEKTSSQTEPSKKNVNLEV